MNASTGPKGTQTSPLLRLPAELRLTIYEMVLIFSTPLKLQDAPSESESPDSYTTKKSTSAIAASSNITALLSVCKTTHNEARYTLYKKNTFQLSALEHGFQAMFKNHPNFNLIRHIHLDSPAVIETSEEGGTIPDVEATTKIVDENVSACIKDLLDLCPGLETLEVEMLNLMELQRLRLDTMLLRGLAESHRRMSTVFPT